MCGRESPCDFLGRYDASHAKLNSRNAQRLLQQFLRVLGAPAKNFKPYRAKLGIHAANGVRDILRLKSTRISAGDAEDRDNFRRFEPRVTPLYAEAWNVGADGNECGA